MAARTRYVTCKRCNGRKEEPEELRPEGIRMVHVPAQLVLFQQFKDNIPIATLELWICVVMKDGIAQTIYNNSKKQPRIYAKIRNMITRPEHRGKGIMGALLTCAIQDHRIEWVETSWDDSTSDGRNFLLGKGFIQDGDKLISYRPSEDKDLKNG